MLEAALQNFLSKEVNPGLDIIKQASDSEERLRGILEAKLEAGENLPSVLAGQQFLFGSAIRGTKPAPFDDVDLMLVLDGSLLNAIEGGQVVGTAYGSGKSQNILLTSPYLDQNGFVSSRKIMDRIRAVIAETYPRSFIRKDGQAINVWMESYGFGIDVVPAIKIYSQARGNHYYIPFGTNSDMWRATNPHADLAAFEAEDARLKGLLRPAAKLMRKWNDLSNGSRLSGFHVDALVFHSLQGKDVQSLQHALLHCLFSFEGLLQTYCNQFSGFQPYIDHALDPEDRRKSIAVITQHRDQVNTALQSYSGTAGNALKAWNAIFSEKLL